MELLKKINFKQPKYMIPALIYFPLLFTGYFAIDMFHTEKAEIIFLPDLTDSAEVAGELRGLRLQFAGMKSRNSCSADFCVGNVWQFIIF